MPTCRKLTPKEVCDKLSSISTKEIFITLISWLIRVYENDGECQAVLATKDVGLSDLITSNETNALTSKLVFFDGSNTSETVVTNAPMSGANIALSGIPENCLAFAQYTGISGGTGEDVLTNFTPNTTICFGDKELITSVTIAFYEMPIAGGSYCSEDLQEKTVDCVKGTVRFINT